MDNLKYYNDSLAYDFKRFEPKKAEPQKKNNVVRMPASRRTLAARSAIIAAVFRKLSAVAGVALVLALICANIFLRAQISEATAKIEKTKEQIEIYDSEVTRLNVECEKIISYSNLETAAHELGMKKMDKSQVVYIRVNDSNAAKNSDGYLIDEDE